MASLVALFGGATVVLSYILLKYHILRNSIELQDEIEKRLQPTYHIIEPANSKILPHTKWPSEEIYFEIWHVEVYENPSGRLTKWLPWGKFQGSTIIKYKVTGRDPPSVEQLRRHGHARQPYVRKITKERHNPNIVKVVYDSVDPSSISGFAREFKLLLRDATFRDLNPEADIQHEWVPGAEGNISVRVFDANVSDSMTSEDA